MTEIEMIEQAAGIIYTLKLLENDIYDIPVDDRNLNKASTHINHAISFIGLYKQSLEEETNG